MKIENALVLDKDFIDIEIELLEEHLRKTSSALNRDSIKSCLGLLKLILSQSKPLTPIIQDAWNMGMNELNTNIHGLSNYINETEI